MSEPDGKCGTTEPRKKLWGILERRECWRLSWRGRLSVTAILLLCVAGGTIAIYPFLATTERIDADVLVVEGWVHDYAILSAAREFHAGRYQQIFTTGGPVIGSGGYTNDFNTAASVGADLLKHAGVPAEKVQMVPSRIMDRDRTYASAVALKQWFAEHSVSTRRITILTEDLHARRTRLLFQRALGREFALGIIAVPNPDYDASRWWYYSEGVRDVINEGISYFYAKLFVAAWWD
jgi:uncharacterized SAM-binding protein YcdF (DUF218 family)